MKKEKKIITPDQLSKRLRNAKTPKDALQVLKLAYDVYDSLVSNNVSKYEIQLACIPGCSFCCYLRVGARAHEVLLISEHIKLKWSEAGRKALISELGDHTNIVRKMTKADRYTTNIKCPLLQGTQCMVYPIRPLGCRLDHSQDVEACKFSYEHPENMQIKGNRNPDLFKAIYTYMGIVRAIYKYCGYDDYEYELGMALHAALTSSKCLRRWQKHKKAFFNIEQE